MSAVSEVVSAIQSIPPRQRLIVALDVPGADAARSLVQELGDAVEFYKIGLELMASGGYFELLDWLLANDKRVFADLKLYDIPATVAAAVRQLAGRGASFVTVHGDRAIIEAAASEKGSLRILAVTVLTSIGREDLREMGIAMEVEGLVLQRARIAVAAGCDGLIASGLEAAALRAELGPGPRIVTPGVRPAGTDAVHDQKRVVTPARALASGADYIVMGRPIRSVPSPRQAAEAVQAEIAATLR
ncbi:MAG: orotidine-5'-phosphate decarboxylase [Proteobacteria bacterium]|nr:orotidine-5'-phosphate decarboxylase [Pseudomonadota bacterium]